MFRAYSASASEWPASPKHVCTNSSISGKVAATFFRTSERRSRRKRNKWKGPAAQRGKQAVYGGLLLDRSGAFCPLALTVYKFLPG